MGDEWYPCNSVNLVIASGVRQTNLLLLKSHALNLFKE